MIYYIFLPDDNKKLDLIPSTNILGESSTKLFYPEQGFKILKTIITEHERFISKLEIITSDGKQISVEEFFNEISNLRIVNDIY